MEQDIEIIERLNKVDEYSFHELVREFSEFDEFNKKNDSFSEDRFSKVFDIIKYVYYGIPIEFKHFELIRSRKIAFSTIFENIKQITYPHPSYVKNMSRCNFKGRSIFYAANSIEAALLEWKIGKDDCAIAAKFNLKDGEKLSLVCIGEVDHFRRYKKTLLKTNNVVERIENLFKKLDIYPRFALQYVDAFLSDYFKRIPGEPNKNVYDVTARISNFLFEFDFIDGIVFDSVRFHGGLNVAIKPKVFDNKFELSKYLVTSPIKNNGYGIFEFFVHSEGTKLNEDGDFIWQFDPRFNARMTIPYKKPK